MADPSLSWVEWLLALSTGALTAFALKVVFPSFRRTRLQEGGNDMPGNLSVPGSVVIGTGASDERELYLSVGIVLVL